MSLLHTCLQTKGPGLISWHLLSKSECQIWSVDFLNGSEVQWLHFKVVSTVLFIFTHGNQQ
jgi:hypothetical protein